MNQKAEMAIDYCREMWLKGKKKLSKQTQDDIESLKSTNSYRVITINKSSQVKIF